MVALNLRVECVGGRLKLIAAPRVAKADDLAADVDVRVDVGRDGDVERVLIRDRQVQAAGVEPDVDLAAGVAATLLRVAVRGAGTERAEAADLSSRDAEAVRELRVECAREELRQLREARGCDSHLPATFDRLIGGQLASG